MRKLLFSGLAVLFTVLPAITQAQTATQSIDANGNATTTVSGTDATGAAYQFQREGIFSCNQNGAYAMSVGATSAIGGTYVPVADAAVELNTGTLVYKECVLREVIDTEKQAELAALLKKMDVAIQSGRNGQPLYVVNEGQELLDTSDTAFTNFMQGPALSNLNPALQGDVTQAMAQNYYAETRLPQTSSLACPYQGDLTQWWSGQDGFNFSDFWDASQPQCDPVEAYYIAQDVAQNRYIGPAVAYQQDQWNWGNGFYPVTDQNGNTVTPASVVQQSFEQLLQSPVQQLQSANDIGQMTDTLYAGVTAQVVTDNQGLAGITESVGGQPSYLDQVVSETNADVRNSASNVALTVLESAQQIEQAYFNAVSGIATSLTQTVEQLRTAENQCWALIIPKVCTSSLSSANKCQDSSGSTLTVATSTVFSQAVIDAQITPIATTTVAEIQASQQALQLINNLIQGVTNTNSIDVQRISIEQLDSLVAQRELHSQNDVQTVTQQQSAVQDSMQTLVQNTVQDWADGTPGGAAFDGNNQTGWCNVNSQTTLDLWDQKWK